MPQPGNLANSSFLRSVICPDLVENGEEILKGRFFSPKTAWKFLSKKDRALVFSSSVFLFLLYVTLVLGEHVVSYATLDLD